jgi:hypothetical protein
MLSVTYKPFMLSVITRNVMMLHVIILSVIIWNVMMLRVIILSVSDAECDI